MTFVTVLETNANALPEEWRSHVIHYAALKKKIDEIVHELNQQGFLPSLYKNLPQVMSSDVDHMGYSFDEDKAHLKSCIKVALDVHEPILESEQFRAEPLSQDELLSKFFGQDISFLHSSMSSLMGDLQKPTLADVNDTDEGRILFDTSMSVASEDYSNPEEDQNSVVDKSHHTRTTAASALTLMTPSHHFNGFMAAQRHKLAYCFCADSARDTSAATEASTAAGTLSSFTRISLPFSRSSHLSENVNATQNLLTLSPDQRNEEIMKTVVALGAQQSSGISFQNRARVLTTEKDGKRFLIIELTADTAFFDQLGEEVSQLSKLLQINRQEFESKIEDLSKILTVVSSPHNKDMYAWREILKIYLDAQVFVADQEFDRSSRSSEKAQGRLQWFLKEMERSKLTQKFKLSKSHVAFNSLFQLNSELIAMKRFEELNKMAMAKILQKHDKRTLLSASIGFLKYLQSEPFYHSCISKALTYTIGCQLVAVVPQPDDYACPICTSVAWKPIRLNCNHVFCARCVIKAQRRRMLHCPICRQTNAVLRANAGNLDISLMNFIKLYFPKEIKEKQQDSSREHAAEEMEASIGPRGTETPEVACIIM
ncbi:hypothetical protein EC968_009252 [Mortierella alpina]|nr:hypothetical protein EC968_009252 [Mortierella alpina]